MKDIIIFKKVPGYKKYYECSNMGTVRSFDRKVKTRNNKFTIRKGKTLKPQYHKDGSLYIFLWKQGKRKMFKIHRLVLLTFVGPCPKGMECCHNDGNSRNNKLENLRWDTPSNNQKDRIKHGTYQYGEKNPACKLLHKHVVYIRSLTYKSNIYKDKIANKFNISKGYLNEILRNRIRIVN